MIARIGGKLRILMDQTHAVLGACSVRALEFRVGDDIQEAQKAGAVVRR